MNTRRGFSDETLAAVRKALVIGLRAGDEPHRFTALWAVVVEKRVFVRSWSLKPQGWHRVLQQTPRGVMQVAGQEIAVRAVHTRSERLKDAVDRAYREKYHTPAARKYVRDLNRARSRATTTELAPV